MDQIFRADSGNSIVITGVGYEVSPDVWDFLRGEQQDVPKDRISHDCLPTEFLRQRKTLKFMSKQDRLALTSAGKALMDSEMDEELRRHHCGLFVAVGYIPFVRKDAEDICMFSQEGDGFSMARFSTKAFDRINPLLAFACLPNMPAHHLSANLDLQGEYLITYPGTAQLYLALSEAVERLQAGELSWALVGGVADQCNFLVENHLNKVHPNREYLAPDASAFMVLERKNHAERRMKKPLGRLMAINAEYHSKSPSDARGRKLFDLGPAELPLKLSSFLSKAKGCFEHTHQTEKHLFFSRWEGI